MIENITSEHSLAGFLRQTFMRTALDYLISAQHDAGGWGYSTGSHPVIEPTAIALLALLNATGAEMTFQQGISWLLNAQNPDGGWGINENDGESGWHTTLAAICLQKYGQADNMLKRALEWIVNEGTSQVMEAEFRTTDVSNTVDPGALVWPWLPGQVCWIEPTALSVLALVYSKQTPLASLRIDAAIKYFKNNRTPTGGWDIGNAGPLDTIVLPRAYPTSLVLMALDQVAAEEIRADDIMALQLDMRHDPSSLSLASGLLALKVLRREAAELEAQLVGNQKTNGSWDDNPFITGWAMLALRGYL
jgi:hypothetical protein